MRVCIGVFECASVCARAGACIACVCERGAGRGGGGSGVVMFPDHILSVILFQVTLTGTRTFKGCSHGLQINQNTMSPATVPYRSVVLKQHSRMHVRGHSYSLVPILSATDGVPQELNLS